MILLLLKAMIRGAGAADLFATPVQVDGYTTKEGTYVAPHRAVRHKHAPAAKKPEAAPPAPDLFTPRPDASLNPPKPRPEPAPTLFSPRPAAKPSQDAEDAKAIARWSAACRDELTRLMGLEEDYSHGRAKPDAPEDRRSALMVALGHGMNVKTNEQKDASLAAVRAARADLHKPVEAPAPPESTPEPARVESKARVESTPKAGEAAPAPEHDQAGGALPPEKPVEDAPPPPAAGAWGVPSGTSATVRRKLNAAALAILEDKTDDEMTPEDRDALARYTGNGGCGDSLNEFYTEPDVAAAMWSMLASAGFQGGEVLEPSCGTGVFLRTAPAGAHVTGVELDGASSRIARILHPDHDVRLSSLERFATQDGAEFDAVIGNAPFGRRGDTTKGDPDKRSIRKHEQYFLDTGLDKLRDGGLMAMIVDTGVMNSANGRAFRERLLRKAEFLGAHRLPNTAFKAANTDVTTDILLFRKRPAVVAGALATLSQKQLRAVGVWDADFLSGYFEKRGAPNVYGTVGTAMRSFGPIYTVDGDMEGVADGLARWHPDPPEPGPDMPRILAALGDDEAAKKRALDASQKRAYQVAKLGDIRVIDGVRYILQGEPPRWHSMGADVPQAVTAALAVSEGLADLIEGRAKDPALTRAEVADALNAYIDQHGLPSKNKDLLAWLAQPSLDREDGEEAGQHQARVIAAKQRAAHLLGAVNKDGSYSDVITGHMATKGEAGLDTVANRLAVDKGGFTVEQLAQQSAQPPEAVLDHLHASPNYAIDPDGRTWTTMDAYLSGELWPKFDAATAAAAHEGIAPEYRLKYEAQARALEEAIAPKSLEDVPIDMASGFITPADLTAFFTAKMEKRLSDGRSPMHDPGGLTIIYDDAKAYYTVKGISYHPDHNLVDLYLNRKGVRKTDRDHLDRLNAEFAEWVRTGPLRDDIEDRYNRLYKGFRQREYSEAPFPIPGLAPGIDINGYHYSGLRWAMEQGKGIIADDVGLGKTVRGLILAKLAKVNGTARKPTFVVPKSVLANWCDETQFWFPGSRVLVIGESYEQNADGSFKRDKAGKIVGKSDTEAQRREKFHALQQNDYDFVLISAPAWDRLDLSPEKKKAYSDDEFWAKRGESLKDAKEKKQNKARDMHDAAMNAREFARREDTIHFDDLGIDMLLMDEAHAYKNLFAARNRFGMSPKFLGGSGESNRALDTYFKTKFVREGNDRKNVFMLTATPTQNSPLEVYSMLSHIAPEAFERMGIKNSEAFIDRFVSFESQDIVTVSGAVKEELVTSGFQNLGELREVMRRYISRRTAEDVGLVLPEAENLDHLLDMTADQERVYEGLRQEAEAAQSGGSDTTGESHIFSIMDRMQKASTDLALLGHSGASSPKIDAVADNAAKHSAEGSQIIFCEPVDEHERIADALVKRGIPRSEIGIVNAQVAKDGAARQQIADSFNSGKIKFIIGNKTMEQGMNLQKLTSDIHHVDIAWNPSTMQQRNGRGRRQGNKRKNIRLHTYLAKKSFDVYRHQTIAAKKNWQDLLWHGGDTVENLEREGKFSLQDVSVMLSPDPEAALAKIKADTAAAKARKLAAERAKAVQSFKRLRVMKANLAKLRADKKEGSPAALRLANGYDRALELLRNNAHFPHKDLLDSDEAAIVEPVTGVAWRAGMGMEVAPGPESALKVEGDRPERFVVDVVDADNNMVWLRSVGDRRRYPVSLTAEQLQNGVTPWTYSAAAEEEEREQHALSRGDDLTTLALGHHDFSKVHALPPAVAAKYAPTLQAGMKDRVRNYTMSAGYGGVPMIDAAGKPQVLPNYEVAKKLDDHDFMLPTPEHREAAINAFVDTRMGRTLKTKYSEPTRRGGSYQQVKELGVKPEYQGTSYTTNHINPWNGPLKDIHGEAALKEAHARVTAKVTAQIAAADTVHDAFEAASKAVKLGSLGYGGGWPAPVVRALWDRAKAMGRLNESLNGEVHGLQTHRLGKPSMEPAGHKHLYKIDSENWHQEHGLKRTVGAFLQRVATGELKGELEREAAPAAAEAA